MYILDVIPLRAIPRSHEQVLSYFSSAVVAVGAVIEAPLGKPGGKGSITGIVLRCATLRERKLQLRKGADFRLRPITRIIQPRACVSEIQLALVQWMSDYYWTPLGVALKTVLPPQFAAKQTGLQGIVDKKHPRGVILHVFPDRASLDWFVQQCSEHNQHSQRIDAVYHSDMSAAKRQVIWDGVASGIFQNIAGTRGSIFLPFQNIEQLIVHHEQSPYYKSWDQHPRYDTRAVAQRLAHLHKAPVIYESYVPSVQSYYYASRGSMKLRMPDEPTVAKPQSGPALEIIDLRRFDNDERIISPRLLAAIKSSQHAILYSNRRGFATAGLCPSCGHIYVCSNCQVPLKLHAQPPRFLCHQCGKLEPVPAYCPECGSAKVRLSGGGTQRLERLIQKQIPTATIMTLDADATPRYAAQQRTVHAFQTHEFQKCEKTPCILVCTAMGLKFADSLRAEIVAMVNLDTELAVPSYDSQERLLQTLDSLRRMSQNTYIIQTYRPDQETLVFHKSGTIELFYQKELELRRTYSYPPFVRFIRLSIRKSRETHAASDAQQLYERLVTQCNFLKKKLPDEMSQVRLFGPAPSPLPRIRGMYEYQIIISLGTTKRIIATSLLRIVPSSWTIDVDPRDII